MIEKSGQNNRHEESKQNDDTFDKHRYEELVARNAIALKGIAYRLGIILDDGNLNPALDKEAGKADTFSEDVVEEH